MPTSLIETVDLVDEAADRLDPNGPAARETWAEYRVILSRPKPKPNDAARLGELCAALKLDRETLRIHSQALETAAELEAVVARREEINAERDDAFRAERDLDERIVKTLKALEGEREAIRARKTKAFAAAESVLLAEKQRDATTGHFAPLFGRDPSTVNQSAAAAGLPCDLKNAIGQLERRAAGKRGVR